MVVKFGMISEFRDEETGAHIRRISYYAKLFGQLLDFLRKNKTFFSIQHLYMT